MLCPAPCLFLVRLSSFLFTNAFLNFYFYFLSQLLYCTLTCFSIVILIYFSLSSLYLQCCLFFKYFHLICLLFFHFFLSPALLLASPFLLLLSSLLSLLLLCYLVRVCILPNILSIIFLPLLSPCCLSFL